MTNYDVVFRYASLIKPAVLSGQMPPWHADPHVGQFANDTRLAPEQVDLLVNWIDRGAPRGTGTDPIATNVPPPVVDWPRGPPNAVVSIAPQSIPATGTVDYRYLIAQSPFTSNVWLRAAALKPGNRSVVHHCLVFTGTLQDVINLRSGERWAPAHEALIHDADIFQLFWSWNSLQSDYVQKEWRYALGLRPDYPRADAVFSSARLSGIGFRFLYPTIEQGLQQVLETLHE